MTSERTPMHPVTEGAEPPMMPNDGPLRRRSITRVGIGLVLLIAVVAVVVVGLFVAFRGGEDGSAQTSDVNGQGGAEPMLATSGAHLTRRADGLFAEVDVPTPAPGSYEYATADMIPPGADPHPRVAPGASDAPEVFTLWLFAFNAPEHCTTGVCDSDDLALDAAARGGVYQVDGLIADGDTMMFSGRIRIGQVPNNGVPLENPIGAEVHVAIAAHGRALPGTDGWRQLNGPLGNPSLWWAASFQP